MTKQNSAYDSAFRLARRGHLKDRPRVVSLLETAVSENHLDAIHALATWYLFGVGVRRNFRKGFELELRAAKLGVSEAAFNVATSYETGKGVPRNARRGFEYYKRAARLGDRDALYEVGRCLYYGIGVPQDRALAERWFARARRAGTVEALAEFGKRDRKRSPRRRA